MNRKMIWRLVALAVVLGAGGFLVAASGIIPIGASSGHWAITEWILKFSMRRSVATHSLGVEPPPLTARSLLVKGATQYEIGCRPCHGSPELRHPRVMDHMLPPPPYLPDSNSSWKPEELFQIVKHGVKFTGMPAWPSMHRDDEVWAMVAFLRAFPQLDAAAYRRLTSVTISPEGDDVSPGTPAGADSLRRLLATRCDRCHGTDGLGGGTGGIPALAGQRAVYLAASLRAYATGTRHSGIMEPAAVELPADRIREIADHYAALPPPAPAAPDPEAAASLARGEAIALQGIPSQEVPACAQCHGPGTAPLNPNHPRLAGQYPDYLVLQLELFKQERRGGTSYAHLMRQPATGLSTEQMQDVARYYATQKGRDPIGSRPLDELQSRDH